MGEWRIGSYYLKGIEFQFGNMKNVLAMDSDDGCTIGMYFMSLNCILKMIKINLKLYILYHRNLKKTREWEENWQ